MVMFHDVSLLIPLLSLAACFLLPSCGWVMLDPSRSRMIQTVLVHARGISLGSRDKWDKFETMKSPDPQVDSLKVVL